MSKLGGQPRPARQGVVIVLLALLAPQGTLLLLRAEPRLDPVVRSATVHLVVVSVIAACALAVAVAAAVAAGRSRDGSLVLLALGCLATGLLMLGHGLTTPGIWGRPPNLWVARLPVLSPASRAACARPPGPDRAGGGRAGRRRGGALVALAARVRPGAAGLVVACLLGAGALVSLQVGALWRLSWWDHHAFLLTGFAAAIYAVLTGYRRTRTLEEVLEGVFAADPMAHISRGYSETLRALIGAVEARDAYTHGHSARVAELAVHLGQRLGLRPAALRHLVAGRGSHFDPVCLDAFLALMAERGHRPGPGESDPAVADAAAQACHDEPRAVMAATPPSGRR